MYFYPSLDTNGKYINGNIVNKIEDTYHYAEGNDDFYTNINKPKRYFSPSELEQKRTSKDTIDASAHHVFDQLKSIADSNSLTR